MEAGVLGALLMEPWRQREVFGIIQQPEVFYDPQHLLIWEAILETDRRGYRADLLTVTDHLRRHDNLEAAGGPYYLTGLMDNVTTAANTESHARILVEKFLARELIRINSEMTALAYDQSNDIFDVLDKAEDQIYNITSKNVAREVAHIKLGVMDAIEHLEKMEQVNDTIIGVATGFRAIDEENGGDLPGELVVVAARPGMGKTAFVLNLAVSAAANSRHGGAGGIISLEMQKRELILRMAASVSGVPFKHVQRPVLASAEEKVKIQEAMAYVSRLPLFIDDTADMTIMQLRSKARRLKAKHDIKFLIVDYLQLIKGRPEDQWNRALEVGGVSRELKKLAKELGIPIYAVCMLNREVDKENRKPRLSDLKESGSIEQDADKVVFLWRAGDEELQEKPHLFGIGHVIYEKNRNGPTKTYVLGARMDKMSWFDLDEYALQEFAAACREAESKRLPGGQIGSGKKVKKANSPGDANPVTGINHAQVLPPEDPDNLPF